MIVKIYLIKNITIIFYRKVFLTYSKQNIERKELYIFYIIMLKFIIKRSFKV